MSPSEEQYELLLQRLKERVQDGGSETIFDIGIGEGTYNKIIDKKKKKLMQIYDEIKV